MLLVFHGLLLWKQHTLFVGTIVSPQKLMYSVLQSGGKVVTLSALLTLAYCRLRVLFSRVGQSTNDVYPIRWNERDTWLKSVILCLVCILATVSGWTLRYNSAVELRET